MSWTKGYKAFNKVKGNDKAGECRGFIFEEGETYEFDGEIALCGAGFHACKELILTSCYYPDIMDNVYAEVELLGDIEYEQPTHHKAVTSKIKIVRFISISDVVDLDKNNNSGQWNSGNSNSGNSNSGHRNSGNSNSGDSNSGDSNSGNRNSGNRNSGNRNSGNRNSGYSNSGDSNSGDSNSGNRNSGNRNSGNRNSGNWNACNYETGAFNTEQSDIIRVFNKTCDRREWEQAAKPGFLYFIPCKEKGYKASFQESFKGATERDIELLKALPNFDADVFFEISGIRID